MEGDILQFPLSIYPRSLIHVGKVSQDGDVV